MYSPIQLKSNFFSFLTFKSNLCVNEYLDLFHTLSSISMFNDDLLNSALKYLILSNELAEDKEIVCYCILSNLEIDIDQLFK